MLNQIIAMQAQGRIGGAITVEDSKEFSVLFPGVSSQPVAQSHFRFDPSLGELQQLGELCLHNVSAGLMLLTGNAAAAIVYASS